MKRILIASIVLVSYQANAILMVTEGDLAITDPAISTTLEDTFDTSRNINQVGIASTTTSSAAFELNQTTNSDIYYIPLSYSLPINLLDRKGTLELNAKLAYSANNDFGNSSGLTDSVIGASYYTVSDDLVIRASGNIKLATGEFNDGLSTDTTDLIFSGFFRKTIGRFGIKGSAGYTMRGTGPNSTDYGDTLSLMAGGETKLSSMLWLGSDLAYVDTAKTTGFYALSGITTIDLGAYVSYRLDNSLQVYSRLTIPVSESVSGAFATEPDRDTSIKIGISTQF